jgi:lysophospholipase L1-like esterase
MVKRFLVRLLVFAVLAVFVMEGTVRVFAPQQLIRYDAIYVTDDGLGQMPAPDLDVIVNTGERDVLLKTDAYGHRIGAGEQSTAPDIRVLAVGDSFTAALQVDYEQTMTAHLESQLSGDMNKKVQVVNAGNASLDVNGYRIAAARELSREQYDLVVVFIYSGNDFTDRVVESYAPRPLAEQTNLRLPRSLSLRELQNALLYPINNWLEMHSHLFVLLKDRASIFLARLGLSARYFPSELLRENRDDPMWLNTAQILAGLRDDAAGQGTPVIFVLLPTIYQVDQSYIDWAAQAFGVSKDEVDVQQPSRLLSENATRFDLDLIDVLPSFEAAFEAGTTLYGQVDTHLSPEGHELVASAIEAHVQDILESDSP